MLILSRINPAPIIVRHFLTFYDDRTKKPSWVEIVLLLTCITAGSISFFFLDPALNDQFQSSLLNFYAIVGGFLVSALFVITNQRDISSGSGLPPDEVAAIKKLRSEIFGNISFGVLLAFLGSGMCVMLTLGVYPRIMGSAIVGTFIIFIHTLLVVIKRLDIIFKKLE